MSMTRGTFTSIQGPELDCVAWLPDGRPRGVVQFIHGMAEYIDRYERPARALNEAGYAVVGHTHLGHGQKAQIKGWFGEKNGWQSLIEDAHALRVKTQKQYPDLPYFILGHSMGSFVARCYLMDHADGLAGAVLSGTGSFESGAVTGGLAISNLICLFGGAKKPSPLISSIGFSSNNKAFEPARTPFDWLSRDEAEVDKYVSDPLCGFMFTAGGYRDMFRGIARMSDVRNLSLMPKALPVYFMSGDRDPVGSMGEGVKKVSEAFRQAGMTDVTVRLYPDGRHEMFNELNREEVYQNLIDWLDSKLPA